MLKHLEEGQNLREIKNLKNVYKIIEETIK